jgi:hypothetical protein
VASDWSWCFEILFKAELTVFLIFQTFSFPGMLVMKSENILHTWM